MVEIIYVPLDDFEQFERDGYVLRKWQIETVQSPDLTSPFAVKRLVGSLIRGGARVLKVYVWDRGLCDWGNKKPKDTLHGVTGAILDPTATLVCMQE